MRVFSIAAALLPALLQAHAPILPPIKGPLTTRGALIVDRGEVVTLRGVDVPGLDATDATYGVIRIRCNLNTVRLPVDIDRWRRDGSPYLDLIAAAVERANAAGLAAVLAARQESAGLPDINTVAFWRAAAARFKDNPRVVFSVFRRPQRTAGGYRQWRTAMQPVADAIRETGAAQLIAVSAFHDATAFSAFATEDEITGGNIVYEVHPLFEFALTDAARDGAFGSLAARLPVYAGEWGVDLRDDSPACRDLPRDTQRLTEILFETFLYFDRRQISWTASTFRAGSLIVDDIDYLPTVLDRLWTCSQPTVPQPGMGEVLLYQSTGDPGGFGSLRAALIANAAGGPASPVAPGQLLSIYTEQFGPDPAVAARFDASGRLPVAVAGAYQITVQVPYELAPGSRTTVQVFANAVPSNRD